MSFEALMGQAAQLGMAVEAAAAAGTHLRSTLDCAVVHESVADHLEQITELALPGASQLPKPQREALAGVLISILRQAADLVENPSRAPHWDVTDDVLVQSTARASMSVALVLAQVAPQLGDLSQRLAGGGAFLDVGTGAGRLAAVAATQWPEAHVHAIDIAPEVIETATATMREFGVDDRAHARVQDVTELDSTETYDLIWLPGPFLSPALVPTALDRCRDALRPGGWIAFGIYGGPDHPLAQLASDVRTIRSGGHNWTADDAAGALIAHGFNEVRELERTWQAPVRLIVGRQTIPN